MSQKVTSCNRCRNCRLKCDGQEPCSRCATAQEECSRIRTGPNVGLSRDHPVPEASQTHYTISEDTVATTARSRLFAIESISDPTTSYSGISIPRDREPDFNPPLPDPSPYRYAYDGKSPWGVELPSIGSSQELPGSQNQDLARQIAMDQRARISQQEIRAAALADETSKGISDSLRQTPSVTPPETQFQAPSRSPTFRDEDIFVNHRRVVREGQQQGPTYFHKSSRKPGRGWMSSDSYVLPSQDTRPVEGDEETQNYTVSEHVGIEESSTKISISDTAPTPHANLVQQMKRRIIELEAENLEYHRRELQRTSRTEIQIFHCLADHDDVVYLSEPDWEIHDDNVVLRGQFPVSDPHGYVERKGNIAFIVYKRYEEEHQRANLDEAIHTKRHLPKPEPANEEIELVSDEMIKAITAFFSLYPTFRSEFPEVTEKDSLNAPYIWWYHCRKSPVIHNLLSQQAELVLTLTSWIDDNYASLYDEVDDQFRRGQVSRMSMEYLIRPGRVLVSTSNGTPKGYVATSRPSCSKILSKDNGEHEEPCQFSWSIKSRSFAFEGDFYQCDQELTVNLNTKAEREEVEFANLNVLPLEYVSSEVRKRLRRRGETFWKCRNKYFVSYEGAPDGKQDGQRFMIDFDTYKELHPLNKYSSGKSAWSGNKAFVSIDGSGPTAPDIYLFPTQVPGFDLRRKKWVDLEVDRIRDVTWNEQAFKSLVADENMKELILALVTNHLAPDKGTGKTFTAESVAEIARKPLYPVTCGDIGTEPGAVEKYLDSVFHLEQRTLQDLGRNALVSVFLRALEYYEGILILTTNRVGTFDEAFKSRIQLALRYEKLEKHQREQIWRNYFRRLKELGEHESIDFDEVQMHMDELASYPMNGRQIRNSITTARQLAKYKKKMMTFTHLKQAITAAEKFDSYLAAVREADIEKAGTRGMNGRYSDEYFARTDGIR